MTPHKWSLAEIGFLLANSPGRRYSIVTAMFNEHFGLNLSCQQVKYAAGYYGSRNGLRGGRGSGKGATNPRYKPVGTERIKNGYTVVKTADPSTWRMKHVWVWESAYGPVPKGHVIIFGDGDKRNFAIENLMMISRKQLGAMNRKGLLGNSAELTKAGALLAQTIIMARERMKECAT